MRYAIDPDTGCWNWVGAVQTNGYGYARVNGKRILAHRLVYQALIAWVPHNSHVHHRCGNKRCINPGHLEAMPLRDHHQLHNPSKTICKHGHFLDESNTYIRKDRNGRVSQQCRACKARRERERQRRLRAQKHG